jgi:iron complex outermembrane receptor protein
MRLTRIELEDGLPQNAANVSVGYAKGCFGGLIRARWSAKFWVSRGRCGGEGR